MKRFPKSSLYNGDVLEVLKNIKDETYTSIVSDPPYGLSFMGKKWDYDVPSIEVFRELMRVTKKGGMILCFGGSRTFHRMACNMEDAGWILRDTIMWIYGSGFPKSHNISKAMKKMNKDKKLVDSWDGYGTALKPAFEPIIVAMKPMDGSFVENAINEKVSGFNLDDCRIGNEEITISTWDTGASFFDPVGTTNKKEYTNRKSKGRWPANVIHDGSDEVLKRFPYTKSGKMKQHIKGGKFNVFGKQYPRNVETIGDSGSASRFFYCAKPSTKEKNKGCESLNKKRTIGGGGIYNAEAGRIYGSVKTANNNFHPTVKPIALMSYLVRLCTMPKGTRLLDPYMGSGTTVVSSILEGIDCDGIERDPKYIKIAQNRIKQARKDYLSNKSGK